MLVNINYYPTNVQAADFTGDQRPDILVSNYGRSTTDILINNGTDGFSTSKTILNRGVAGIAPADYNKDGKLAFAFSGNASGGSNAGNLGIALGDGAGNFSTPAYYTLGVDQKVCLLPISIRMA